MGISKLAVVGATGNVGREMLNILSERNFPCEEVIALASERSEGDAVPFGNKELIVQSLSSYDFSETSIALFSAGGKISEVYGPIAAEQGCIVIDNSSKFRMDNDVPLIVPEVNIEMLEHYRTTNIIANPNCSTIQMRPDILINATCVRVPTFIGHAESINLEFDSPISEEEAREVLEQASGCIVYDEREDGGYSTPVEAAGHDATYISRIRVDETVEYGLNLWVVSDNLRKGAALNAIQIAEAINEDYLY